MMSKHIKTRRWLLKKIGFLSAGLTVGGLPSCSWDRRPNILFLFTDDQRFDTIASLGNLDVKTPNIDRIVKRGTSFTNAYIMGAQSAAVCAPSRAMLLTGRTMFNLPQSFYEYWEVPLAEQGKCPYVTMPETLRKAAYSTFATGKMHNGKPTFVRGFTHGGNIFFGGMSNHRKVPVHEFEPDGNYTKKNRKIGKTFSSKLFSDATIDFLENYKDEKPFFAYVSYTSPHDPRMAPQEYKDMYPHEQINLPENFMRKVTFDNGTLGIRDEKIAPYPRTTERTRKEIAGYYAMITHLDHHIGRVFDTLEKSGHADNTIIVFASDNGLATGRHALLGKQNLYEHSIHVPLVFAGPGIPKNEERSSACYLLDIFPTMCEMTGTDIPDSVEGISLLPVIKDFKKHIRDEMFYAYSDSHRCVRNGDLKLIEYNVRGKRHTQLFNIRKDPHELKNLADNLEYQKTLARFRKRLEKNMKKHNDTRKPADFIFDERKKT